MLNDRKSERRSAVKPAPIKDTKLFNCMSCHYGVTKSNKFLKCNFCFHYICENCNTLNCPICDSLLDHYYVDKPSDNIYDFVLVKKKNRWCCIY